MSEDLEARLTRLARTPATPAMSLSPDGRRVVFSSSLGGLLQAWTVPAEGGAAERLLELHEPVHQVAWSPDGRWVGLVVAPGGGMNTQVHVVRPDGTGHRRLTAGGSETNQLTGWSPRGHLLLATNERVAAGMEVLLVDPDTGDRRVVTRLDGVGGATDVSPDGGVALVYRVRQRGDSDIVAVDLRTGEEVPLTPHAGRATNRSARFSADGRWVYLVTNVARDRLALARRPLADGAGPLEIVAARPDAELDDLETSADRRRAVLSWNHAGRFELELVDLASGERLPGPEPPAEVVRATALSADGGRLAMLATGAASPANVWVWDRESGRVTRATRAAPDGVDLAGLMRPELVRFQAHDGLELAAWLYRASERPGPVVLQFHGGPEGQEVPFFSARYQSLVAAGISVLAPNVRGSAGFGKLFMGLDDGPLRFDAVRDIRSCAEFALREGIGRPGHLGVMGASYGGFMTMSGVTAYPELFAAACTIAGLVNFETFFAHTEPWMAAVSKVEYGDPDTQVDLLRRLSPIHRLDQVRAPTLVIHGANDTNVPVVEAEQVVDGLRASGVPVEYLLFPDEGHSIGRTDNMTTATLAIVRWFERWLR